MKFESKTFITISEWEKIPFLVHGFGNKNWQYADFETHPLLRNFKPLYLRQIHSDILHIVDDVPDDVLSGDALLTDRQGLLLVIKTADCLPVLIADPKTKALAAVHCGWRSTSQKLIRKVIQCLVEHFQCDPSSLLAALGPCIGKDCYEVGEDVRDEFEKRGLTHDAFLPHPQNLRKFYLDLLMATRHQLLDGGVKRSHISQVDLCTHCEEFLLSYRRSQQKEGRMLSFIGRTFA
ncbi:MAG: peptidoglycan editing factor PgeF [Candidatus Aminicenantes bacterium]|nr:MAG: peptidoglycan editing factor PgeF [Candidatus Aminicenantes bacterium]